MRGFSARLGLFSLLSAVTLVLAACSPLSGMSQETAAVTPQQLLESYGWADLTGAELVETLDALPLDERPVDLMASVRSEGVQVTSAEGDAAWVPIEEDFYLSIAPFREQTHPCGFHSLTTCQGELANTPVTISVRDVATGDLLREEELTTAANGFVGLWLPRDGQFSITVVSAGESATTVVSTGVDDPTCLTTLQLTA